MMRFWREGLACGLSVVMAASVVVPASAASPDGLFGPGVDDAVAALEAARVGRVGLVGGSPVPGVSLDVVASPEDGSWLSGGGSGVGAESPRKVAQADGGAFADLERAGVHRGAVEALAALGVFEGTECGEGLFCPRGAIQRWVMAVWLVRILDDGAAPAGGGTRFDDVDPAEWWAPYVERLAELGVTKGCRTEPLSFCPSRAVTRAQMASFLVRAFGLEAASSSGFVDVDPRSSHAGNIDALAASGLTRGCRVEPFSYCPSRSVTRAQMASFLDRALNRVVSPRELILTVPGSASVVPRGGAVTVSWDGVGGLDEAAQSYLLSWREQVGAAETASSAVIDGLSHTIGGLSNELSYVLSVRVAEVNRVQSVGATVTAAGDAVPVVEQVQHPETVNASMEVSPYADPVRVIAPEDTVWPINVAVPVDFSKVAPGDFLYLMHRPSSVDEWMPVPGARLDKSRGVLVADVYSDGLFMPIRAKSDVADPRELLRMAAEVPDILRGRSDSEHPFVRLLQGDAGAVAEVDTALLSQYLEVIVDGLDEMDAHWVPAELIDDVAALVDLSKQHVPSAAVRVPPSVGVSAPAARPAGGATVYAEGSEPYVLTSATEAPGVLGASAGGAWLGAGPPREAPARLALDVAGALSHGAYWTGRFLGSRASKPECRSDPPSWVQDILVVEDLNAEVFACGASIPVDELRDDLSLRIVSNRGYPIVLTGRQLFGDEPRVEYEVNAHAFAPDLSGWILGLLRPVLAEDGQIFLAGTETVDLRFFKRSLQPILHLEFQSDASLWGLAVEVFISVVMTILSEVVGTVSRVVKLGSAIVSGWDCLSQVLNEGSSGGANIVSMFEAFVTASCFDVWLGLLKDQVEKDLEKDLKAGFGNRLKGLKRALVVAVVAKMVAETTLRLGDFLVLGSALSGVPPVTLTGRFTIRSPYVDPVPRPLGQWWVRCPSTANDSAALTATSKNLYINLAAREKYTDRQYYLHEISGWDSDAATAVTALTRCGAEGMASVADYIQRDPENYWTEPKSTEIVAENIYETFPELGFGDWTAVCDNTATDIAAMHSNLAALAPFSESSPSYSRFKSFEPALAASAAPLKQCSPDYFIELHERLSGSSVWAGADLATVEAVVLDLLLGLPIVLPDANLNQAVRDQLNVEEGERVTIGDARSATGLDISGSAITNLNGLHYFINLHSLDASNNRITTLTPILNLQYLSDVDLSHNQIRDFAGLSGNDTITRLNISDNLATSLALDKMTALTSLDASNNHITSVAMTELQSLTGVRDLISSDALNLADNPISDLKLGGLRRLSTVSLGDFPHLRSVELIAMPSLTSLTLNNTSLAHIRLDAHQSLRSINLRNNKLTEVLLSRLPALSSLDVSHNVLSELELVDFPMLSTVNVENNQLERLVLRGLGNVGSVVAHVEHLSSGVADVGDNPLRELTVEALPNLRTISLIGHSRRGGTITTLESITLSDLPMLQSLNIHNNEIDTLELVRFESLVDVSAGNNRLTAVSLSELPSLRSVALARNMLSELELAGFPALSSLDVSHNVLSELELVDFPMLSTVNVENNQLERLVLRGLGNVGSVVAHVEHLSSGVADVGDNPLRELTVEALPNLRTISLIGHSRRGGTITTLESITLSDLPMLQSLNIHNNEIDTLELVRFESLVDVSAGNNRLTAVSLSELPSLRSVALARNMLSELELAGFPALSSLDVSHNVLSELELVDFPMLSTVNVENNQLERLVLRGLGNVGSVVAHVEHLSSGVADVGDNPLRELTVEALPNLRTISLIGHSRRGGTITTLESITLSDLPMLQSLNIHNNEIDTLELVRFESLVDVSAGNNRLTAVSLSELPSLRSVALARNMLSELELAGFPALSSLDVSHNVLSELELVDFPMLSTVNVENNQLERLVLRGLGNVGSVVAHVEHLSSGVADVGDNPLRELTVEALPNLRTISLIGHSRRGGTITTLESITLSDLPMLQSLNIHNNEIDTLELVRFESLVDVSAGNNRLTAVSLSELPSLRSVALARNMLSELELAGFPALSSLDVSHNVLSELELVDFPMLSTVNVENNQLERLVLRGLGNVGSVVAHVEHLSSGVADVGDNPLRELTVEALPNLRTISLIGHSRRGGTITTLESITLSDLPMLQSLNIHNNEIDTLELVRFESLVDVSAGNNRLTAVSLSELPSLRSVALARNMLSELELAGFPALSSLDVSHNVLSELELVDFPMLSTVNVENNQLERLVLRGLGNVGSVVAHVEHLSSGVADVGDNPLRELTVEALPNLRTISLIGHSRRGGTITTLESITLSDLPMLQSLNIHNNEIDTLELVRTPILTTIDASNNRIADVGDLGSIISLVTLDLDRNDIRDVSPLASLVNLRTLLIAWNLISDFSPLDPLSDLVIHGKDSQRDE